MSNQESRSHIRRHHATQRGKAIVGFLGIAALTCIAVAAAQHTPLLPNGSSGLLEILMMNPEVPTEMVDAQAASGQATPTVPRAPTVTAPAMDVDYFPNRYVNQATEIEEQPPTF